MTESLPITALRPPNATVVTKMSMREAADKLEATFLAEMLKSAGFGEQDNTFSGSEGEDHFASFQRETLAEQMVRSGGIGLAEVFYQSMMEANNDA